MTKLNITYEENPTPAELTILNDGLCAEAYKKRGLDKIAPFCFFLKDEHAQILGGVEGITYYGCMYIDIFWVEENYRGKGYGRALMIKAEELSVLRKCTFVTVNTMDFEAKPFYERLGYEVEFERKGYQKNSILYFLYKELK